MTALQAENLIAIVCAECKIVCENCGKVDEETCKCSCAAGWFGDFCESTPTTIIIIFLLLLFFIFFIVVVINIFFYFRRF